MIEEQLENHLHEGEEEHMHTHVLEDGTTPAFPWRTRTSPQSCTDEGCSEPAFQSNRAPGIHQTYGGRRQGLQRSADPAFSSEICY